MRGLKSFVGSVSSTSILKTDPKRFSNIAEEESPNSVLDAENKKEASDGSTLHMESDLGASGFVDKLSNASKKFYGANKQLISVGKHLASTTTDKYVGVQLAHGHESLSNWNEVLSAESKKLLPTHLNNRIKTWTIIKYVKMMKYTMQSGSFLLAGLKSAAQLEGEVLKQIAIVAKTMREAVTQVMAAWDSFPLSLINGLDIEQLRVATKQIGAVAGVIESARAGEEKTTIVTLKGTKLELAAACRAAAAATSRMIYTYTGKYTQNKVSTTSLKVAASTTTQVLAVANNLIAILCASEDSPALKTALQEVTRVVKETADAFEDINSDPTRVVTPTKRVSAPAPVRPPRPPRLSIDSPVDNRAAFIRSVSAPVVPVADMTPPPTANPPSPAQEHRKPAPPTIIGGKVPAQFAPNKPPNFGKSPPIIKSAAQPLLPPFPANKPLAPSSPGTPRPTISKPASSTANGSLAGASEKDLADLDALLADMNSMISSMETPPAPTPTPIPPPKSTAKPTPPATTPRGALMKLPPPPPSPETQSATPRPSTTIAKPVSNGIIGKASPPTTINNATTSNASTNKTAQPPTPTPTPTPAKSPAKPAAQPAESPLATLFEGNSVVCVRGKKAIDALIVFMASFTAAIEQHIEKLSKEAQSGISNRSMSFVDLRGSNGDVGSPSAPPPAAIAAAPVRLRDLITTKAFTDSTKLIEGGIPPPPPVAPQEEQNSSSASDQDLQADTDIWEDIVDKEDVNIISGNEPGRIRGGSLNKLVERLTSHSTSDVKFLKTFITTYRSFTTPEMLLRKLMQRFEVPSVEAANQTTIQLRICNVLRHWVDNSFFDFDDELLTTLVSFINAKLTPHKSYTTIANSLLNSINQQQASDTTATTSTTDSLRHDSKIPLSPSRLLFVFDEEEIAKQLTLIDFSIYSSIEPVELLNQSWNKPKYRHRSPHVLALIARSNLLANWAASVILWQERLKDRVKIMAKIIAIAKHLRDLNNFNSLVAILAGLNTSAVHRLNFTKAELPKQSQETFLQLEEVMNCNSAYKNYRALIHNVNPPCVPFLGVYLTDLTFVEDGNPDFLKNNLINFGKRELVYNILREIQDYQQTPYKTPLVDNIASFLDQLPCIPSENDMYDLSLLREPRNADKDSIL